MSGHTGGNLSGSMSENTADENWLHALRGDPPPQFKEHLRARLRALEPTIETRRDWPRRVLVAAAAVLLVTVLVSVPAVRASVAQFVSLFRVVNFVAVPVDANRLARLKADNLGVDALIGENVQIVKAPGEPVKMSSVQEAAAFAGMTVATPQWLSPNTQVLDTAVVGEREVRVTANGERLQQVMDALGIDDLTVPAGLDGRVVDVRVPPVVVIRYDHGEQRTRLVQARSPQVTLPEGIDLRALGEIGLRILGLQAAEAKQFAQAIDWNSTLLVPVPPTASSFRQVNINGHLGVVIRHYPKNESPINTVIWSTPDRVFVLMSTQEWDQVLAMAQSVR
jgi:hypothetical protein